jgi:predicted metal-dependent hydrolase
MNPPRADYEPRYLAGVVLFNDREFFDCHEVLEDLWNECKAEDRRFYQAVLQAAVALYHFGNGNLRGAAKLFRSAKAYMDPYPNPHQGLDKEVFWRDMAACFAEIHKEGQDMLRRDLRPDPALVPTIALDPPPVTWPDPKEFLHDDDDE